MLGVGSHKIQKVTHSISNVITHYILVEYFMKKSSSHNKENNRIVFVHSFFYPDYSAGSQMLSDLSFYLADEGFDVTIVTSRKMYDGSNKTLLKKEVINDVNIHRVFSSNWNRKSYIGRILNYISLEISIIVKLFNITKKGTIVVFKTDPPLLNIIAYPIIKFKSGLVVNWLQDLFPEVAVSAGLFSKESLINRLLSKFRNLTLKNSNKNIVIGNRMLDYLLNIGIDEKKIIKIENWSDGDEIYSISNSENSMRNEWQLEDQFVVGYSGNLGRAHDISTIITVIDELKFVQNITFLFIGGGVGLEIIKSHVEKNNLNNVIFKPYQDRDLLVKSLNIADVHWVTLDPQMEGFIVPSKFYGILAAAKPVIFIGDKNGELAQDIRRIGCGESVDIGDTNRLVRLIKKYSKSPAYVSKIGNLGREEFNIAYNFSIASDKFKKVFNEL